MTCLFHSVRSRILTSRLGSLILLFQRSPLVQMLFPEAKLLGGAGLGEVTKWTVATIAGLGAYDTVTGATEIVQSYPDPNEQIVPATTGEVLNFIVQVVNAPGLDKVSWSISGLPPGLDHQDLSTPSTHLIYGTPTEVGSTTITVTAWELPNQTGASMSQEFVIEVGSPIIATHPASVAIANNTATTLSVVGNANGSTLTYRWFKGTSGSGTQISGAAGAGATYTTPTHTTANTPANYWVRVTRDGVIQNSNTATVTIATAPAFTTQPGSTSIPSGTTATLTVATSGSPPSIQWFQGTSPSTANPVAGATSTSFTTPALTTTTSYWARATNAAGTASSSTATVTVTGVTAPSITTQPASTTIVSGNTTTLSVGVSGSSPSLQWFRGNAGVTSDPVVGATSTSFTTSALTTTTSYWVRATNTAGSADSNTATVTVTGGVDPFEEWRAGRFDTAQLANPQISGPTADPDGDGMTNQDEYLFGGGPLTREPSPLTISSSGGNLSLVFTARQATGPGYSGKTRHYALDTRTNLATGTWTPITGFSDIIGNNQPVTYSSAAAPPHSFYTLRVWLTP
ncbi:Ig-like domain-containing protein [Luteolibacter soli]|uniref:Ig-like domain-containing protein n=1 Tax=Luteolibacter soli TaxID=3135280 RepID=A0ABU9ART2_9BACT